MEKEIHVKSYVKRDGTQVKEHFRTIDTNEKMYENPEPHFPEGEYPVVVAKNPNGGSKESNKGEILEKVLLGLGFVLTVAGEISRAIQSGSKLTKGMIQQFNIGISHLKQESAASDKRLHELLASMSNIHTQEEYSNLLKRIFQEKQLGQYLNRKITIMNHAAQNNDYSKVVNELENYQSDFDDVIKKTHQERPLNKILLSNEITRKASKSKLKQAKNYIKGITGLEFVNAGFATKYSNEYNSKKFWTMASNDFKKSKEYVEKNGVVIYSIKDLPTRELRNIVYNKVKDQLELQDTIGVVFKSQSEVSELIAKSPELKSKFLVHKDALLRKFVVCNESTYLSNNNDLKLSLGHIDIIYMFIDEYGNLVALILDTYDFNKNDPNWKVRVARTTQEASLIRGYYTLTVVKVPIEKWLLWLYSQTDQNI